MADQFCDAKICGSFTGVNGRVAVVRTAIGWPVSAVDGTRLPCHAGNPTDSEALGEFMPGACDPSGGPTLELGRPHFPACASGGQDQSLQPRSGHLGTLALNQQGVSELMSAVAANNGERCEIG